MVHDTTGDSAGAALRAAQSLAEIRIMLAQANQTMQTMLRDDQLNYERSTRPYRFSPEIEKAAAAQTDRILRDADKRTKRGWSRK